MNEFKAPQECVQEVHYPYRSLIAAIIVTFLAIGSLTASIAFSYNRLETFETYIIPLRQLKADVRYYDAILTQSALMFAATGNARWENEYKQAVPVLTDKLAAIAELGRDKSQHIKKSIQALQESNRNLTAIETRAIELTRQSKGREALLMLEHPDYVTSKNSYLLELENIRDAINQHIHQTRTAEKQVMSTSLLFAAVMVLLLLPIAWFQLIRSLSRWRAVLHKNTSIIVAGEQKLQQINLALTVSLEETKRQRIDLDMLSEMGSLLHSCINAEEAYRIMELYCKRLFPRSRGALYRMNASRDVMEEAARWADPVCEKTVFKPSECWALRRGVLHAGGSQPAMVCDHVTCDENNVPHYLCIPLVAQNATFGLFYMELAMAGETVKGKEAQLAHALASAVAEQTALAVANISLRESLREQSVRDQLTGLYNRRYLGECLNRELIRAARHAQPFCIISFDVDHFKRYNDSFGHDAGDKVLRSVGHLLATFFRGSDIACRMGGEEFIVLLPEAPLSGAILRAQTVLKAVSELHLEHAAGNLGQLTVSAGIAEFPCHGQTMPDLLNAADAALYCAKHRGRNRVEIAEKKSLKQAE